MKTTILSLMVFASLTIATIAQTKYTVTDLGVLPGAVSSSAFGINDNGDITGTSSFTDRPTRAFLWSHGVITDISDGGTLNYAGDINNRKEVFLDGNLGETIYQNGLFHSIFPLSNQYFVAINNLGVVLGEDAAGGFLLTNNMVEQRISFSNVVTSINDKNQLAGVYYGPGNVITHAALWQNPSSYPQDLGTLGSTPNVTMSNAYAINNHGHVAGVSYMGQYWGSHWGAYRHGFLFHDGVMHDLGTLGYNESFAYTMNDADTILGYCANYYPPPYASTFFVYQSGKMYDLNTLIVTRGWKLMNLGEINNAGQIVATASNAQFPSGHAVRLNPVPERR